MSDTTERSDLSRRRVTVTVDVEKLQEAQDLLGSLMGGELLRRGVRALAAAFRTDEEDRLEREGTMSDTTVGSRCAAGGKRVSSQMASDHDEAAARLWERWCVLFDDLGLEPDAAFELLRAVAPTRDALDALKAGRDRWLARVDPDPGSESLLSHQPSPPPPPSYRGGEEEEKIGADVSYTGSEGGKGRK